MAPETVKLEIFRYQPDKSDEPTFQTYEVPFNEEWVILDAINHIKDNIDGTLSHRWSCRMGVCGSCGMMVNGTPTLTCGSYLSEHLPGPIRIEPMAHFPVIRDLVVDIEPFLKNLQAVQPWIIREDEGDLSEEYRQTPAQHEAFRQFSLCINCTLCYAACPVFGRDQSFIGPAAIALGQRYNLDSRDEGNDKRADVLASHEGIWDCTFVGDCSRVCPAHVDPAAAIQQAKVINTVDWFKRLVLPKGK
jgi:fumarate reductase iron-sulfur subunit